MTDLETFARALSNELRKEGRLHSAGEAFPLYLSATCVERALAAVQAKPEAPKAQMCDTSDMTGSRGHVCKVAPLAEKQGAYDIERSIANPHRFCVWTKDTRWLAELSTRKHAELFVRALEAQEAGK